MQESVATSEESRSGRAILLRLSIVVIVFAVAAGGLWFVVAIVEPQSASVPAPAQEVEPADVQPRSAVPDDNRIPLADSGGADSQQSDESLSEENALSSWAERIAPTVGIPSRALLAYGNAELVIHDEKPECGLSWTTLAGIGRVESDHGRHDGAELGEDGRPSTPIIGIPLDGSDGVKEIPDTDDGRLDGDPYYDRAVGPMQFIPDTWDRHGRDATGSGHADPQQIDDAALTAADYLCTDQRDMSTPDGWWSGVLAYNNSTEYGQKVFGLAESYARKAETAQTAR